MKIRIKDETIIEKDENGVKFFYDAIITHQNWSEARYFESLKDVYHYAYFYFDSLGKFDLPYEEIEINRVDCDDLDEDLFYEDSEYVKTIDMLNYKQLYDQF